MIYRTAIWGEAPSTDLAPNAIHFDTTTCAGSVNPDRLGQSDWRIVTESNEWYSFYPSVDEYDGLETDLTRLFDEPLRPELDVAGVQVALDKILQGAAQEFDEPVTDIRFIAALEEAELEPAGDDPIVQDTPDVADPPAGEGQVEAEPAVSTRTVLATESSPSTTALLAGVGTVAALVLVAVLAWRATASNNS